MENYYLQKLMDMPKEFNDCYDRKEWYPAKYIYNAALIIAKFLEVSEEIRGDLFGRAGNKDEEYGIPGLFDADKVRKCYEECAVRRNMGHEQEAYRTYEGPITFFWMGQQESYYQEIRRQ